jgi:hypothetical protein
MGANSGFMRRCWVDVDGQQTPPEDYCPHLYTPTIAFPGESSITVDLEIETKQIYVPDGIHEMFQFRDVSASAADGFHLYMFTIVGDPYLILALRANGVLKTYWLGVPFMDSFTHYWIRLTFRVVSISPPETEVWVWVNGFDWAFPKTVNEIFQPFSDRAIIFARQSYGEATAHYSANVKWFQVRMAFAHLGDYAALRTDGYPFLEHANDVFRYNFDESSGTHIKDYSDNGNHGTIEDYGRDTWRWGCVNIPHGQPRVKATV